MPSRAYREPAGHGGSRMRWHRGLALALVAVGATYISLGLWLSTGHGPVKTAFEAYRRYDVALRHDRPGRAAALGEQAIALARADTRWQPTDVAALSADIASTELAAGHTAKALELARDASRGLSQVSPADAGLSRLIDVARTHARIALAAGDGLEASCTFGVLLEQVGADRVIQPEASLHPHPELAFLAGYLTDLGPSFHVPASAVAPGTEAVPLTSCELLADFYAARKDYATAATVSDIVVAAAKTDKGLMPEMHAALLQRSAHMHELQGDIPVAEARLQDAVTTLDGAHNPEASLYALEALGTFLSNWGESARALPILKRALAIRDAQSERNRPQLAPTLLALGYAQLDSNETTAAEFSFKRALAISASPAAPSPSTSFDALNALAELYDGQGRHADAAQFKADAAKLQKTGMTDGAHLRDAGNVVRSPELTMRAIVVHVPFRAAGQPAGGRAQDAFAELSAAQAQGTTEVVLPAPQDVSWTALWPARNFDSVAQAFVRGRVGAPEMAADADPIRAATLLYIPGEASSFGAGAERAARLQAVIGPKIEVALSHWPTTPGDRGLLRDARAERFARTSIAGALGTFGVDKPDAPIALVAEGRGARLLAQTLAADGAVAARMRARATTVVLIAPELTAAEYKALAARFDAVHTRLAVYAAPGARGLLVARDVYHDVPIGLSESPVAGVDAEWIEIGVDDKWADFEALGNDAVLADIGTVLRGGPAADKRCGLARVSEARAGDTFVLNPRGCQPKVAGGKP